MNPTKEMLEYYYKRLNLHVSLVGKYCLIIRNNFSLTDPDSFGKDHDKSKFHEPELTPYVYLTWKYKCKYDCIDFNIPEETQKSIYEAIHHHFKNNNHHPEFYNDEREMPKDSIAEMVADWAAMSEEKGNSLKDWADNNISKRWVFTKNQIDYIYSIISFLESNNK